jgi:hypothetical protein
MGLKVEGIVRRQLEKNFRVNREWVHCNYTVAKAVLESWGKKAQEFSARMAVKL